MDHKKYPSELRFDIVSKNWVVIATGRARRPDAFQEEGGVLPISKEECPFEDLPFENKSAIAVPNKYPAFFPFTSPTTKLVGPYQVMDGVGFHEVLVTKDHVRDVGDFSVEETKELIDLYQERYFAFMKEEFINYIAIFKNKGQRAGATVAHPHSQVIATPVMNPDIQRSLAGSKEYYDTNKKCAHCVMLEWELRDKSRIVFEDDCFVALCPFASTVAFEIRLYPKAHLSNFEKATENEKMCFAQALAVSMKKIKKALNDPDYNYFLHTSPVDGESYAHYHWHLEILPKTSTLAGFELSTGILISTIEPEKAAEFLRKC
ncbi:MAG: HIT domain-containing protein [bacterium]|nr:HIT domain-containing protein [bacterium]